jgi:hypothetical protein
VLLSATLAVAEPNDAAAPAGAGGQWVHVDPATGARTARPQPGAAAAAATNPALSTSAQGLVEEPAPGGGVMVDLKGRFRSAAEATAGADGTTTVKCHAPGVHGGEE